MYQIGYNDRYYGLNSNDEAFVGVSMPRYLVMLVSRSLDVQILAPGDVTFPHSIALKGTELDSIYLEARSAEQQLGANGAISQETAVASKSFEFVSSAQAASIAGARLYVQSITVPASSTAGNASANLISGSITLPLLALTPDAKSTTNASLLLKPGASIIQNFQSFFSLPDGELASKSAIKIQSDGPFFGKGFSEAYEIPSNLKLGVPTALKGTSGGDLVVQLAYPIDVVFFERSDTITVSDKLTARVATAGFAPRQNFGAVKRPGMYNVIYSGEDVPFEAVQKVLDAIKSDTQLRSIQFKRHLSNGSQSQIQIGSSLKFVCLPPIDDATIANLTNAKSEAEFSKLLADVKDDPC